MRRLLAWLLILCFATGGAAFGEAAEAGLPAVGEMIHGFRVKEIRDFPILNAAILLFEHEKTGAGLTWVANEDTNRAFQLTFLTRPMDDTGLPHVFEHATLSGSEKYPSANLWMNLANQTYNTYMNAYTQDAVTCYPIASLSERQLLKYAEYYTDSCLHPMVLQDENIFRTESWRYRLEEEDGDLTIEGTVYTEMQGAMTLGRAAIRNANRITFPGAALSMEEGGDPEHIPEMTWESLKNYHSLFYHPSNSMAYLYGKIQDYGAFLALLDGAYSGYEKTEFRYEDTNYTPITEPVIREVSYPTAAGTDTENQTVICYYILCPGMRESRETELQTDNLCRLLGMESSLLYQNLKKAFPAGSFGVGREVAAPVDALIFRASQVNREDAELFRRTVDESLRAIAGTGFPKDMMDGVTASIRLSTRLMSESGNPVEGILKGLSYSFSVTGDPFAYLDEIAALDRMEEWNLDGTYQRLITTWMTDPELYTLTTTSPEPGLREIRDGEMAGKLAAIRDGMSPEEKQEIIKATLAVPEEDDASAMVASLQAVTVDSLPEEYRRYELRDETDGNGIRHIEAKAGVDGIGYTGIYLDAGTLPQEDIHWMRLFTRLLGRMDTAAHTREELNVLMTRYLYGRSIGVDVSGYGEGWHPYLVASWISLDSDLETGYGLVRELLYETRFDDYERLAEEIQAQKASVRASINQSPYVLELYRGMGEGDPAYAYYNYLNYLDYYVFLDEAERLTAENPVEAAAHLEKIQRFFHNRSGAVATFAGNEQSIAVNRPLADAFMAELDREEREPAVYAFDAPAGWEAIIADTNVQFNSVIGSFGALGIEMTEGLSVVATLVADQLLTPVLRDQYGVYTPMAGVIQNHGMYLLTFRDPGVEQTFAYYAQLPGLIRRLEVGQEVLDGYILKTYSVLAKPTGELSGAGAALSEALAGISQETKLIRMRQIKAVTPETVLAAAEIYQKLWDHGFHSTVGSAGSVRARGEMYEQILNPFGAKDNSQTELKDAVEGDPLYEAVRHVFESGLMDSAEEDRFGTEEPLTAGDWALGMLRLMGGNGTKEDAAANLGAMGLIPADRGVEDPLTREELTVSVQTLCAMVGIGEFDISLPESEEETATRGDAAVLLTRLDTME